MKLRLRELLVPAMLACVAGTACADDPSPDKPPVTIVDREDMSGGEVDHGVVDMSGDIGEGVDAGSDLGDMPWSEDMPTPTFDDGPLRDPIAGRATVVARSELLFSTLIQDLPLESFQAASRGREFFVADWEPAGGRELLDGLGPLFHVPSCVGCHPSTGRPPTFLASGEVGPGILFRLSAEDGGPDPSYGGQLQPRALAGVTPEANIRWYSDDVIARTPEEGAPSVMLGPSLTVVFEDRGYGDFGAGTGIGPRLSPHLTGMGLLDAIPVEDLEALEDPDDADGDGISGRIHWHVREDGARIAGRFGWKGNSATLREQIAGAFLGDMGLTSPVRPTDDCAPPQQVCLEAASGGEFEVTDSGLDAVVAYMRLLGVPARRVTDPERERAGFERFLDVGCAGCHVPRARTREDGVEDSPISGLVIYPYTDLLLHDMGDELADGVADGDATGREWRTPPLWGIGRVADVEHARFLHDGRAATLNEAILAHGGEAQAAADRYRALSEEEREELLTFLRSL